MKAIIKIVTAEKKFTPAQIQIMKRVLRTLIENHELSACITIKEKKTKSQRLIVPLNKVG
jgi:hypothetical protein